MKRLLFETAALTLVASVALGAPIPAGPVFEDGGIALQALLDQLTVGGQSSVTAAVDYLEDSIDSCWAVNGIGASLSTFIYEVPGSVAPYQEFGVYDISDPANKVQLFGGGASAGTQAILGITLAGDVYVNLSDSGFDFAGNAFGYYVDSNPPLFPSYHISEEEIVNSGWDYIALGHVPVFRSVCEEPVKAYYSGSPSFVSGSVAVVDLIESAGVQVTRYPMSASPGEILLPHKA